MSTQIPLIQPGLFEKPTHAMNPNSIAANLTPEQVKQADRVRILMILGLGPKQGMTQQAVAKGMGKNQSQITWRFDELMKGGAVKKNGKGLTDANRPADLFVCVDPILAVKE